MDQVEKMEQMDDAFQQLADPAFIKINKAKADEQYRHISTEDWKSMRRRAKKDLFWLAYAVLGYTRLTVNLHGHLASWYQKYNNAQFREILLPRGHFKSTVITIADAIQTALPDDSGDDTWPRNLGTDCRLCIVHETHDMASRFLFSITGHFTSNILLMGLFPECVPNPKKNRINQQQLELPRTKIWNEPTFDTMGVGAKGQGRHYNRLMLDDLIGDKARDSQTEMQSAKDWFDNIQSFFSLFPKDQFVLVGTRWAYDDLYAHAHKMYEKDLFRYIRGVEEYSEETKQKEPIFPEEFTQSKLRILRKNKKVFSAQYANNPAESATEFDSGWLRYYHWRSPNEVVEFLVNDKGEPAGKRYCNTRDMDRIILVDPALTGKTGYCVVGTPLSGDHYLLEAIKEEWTVPKFIDFLFSQVIRWQPRVVIFEDVLFSALYKPFLEAEMRLRGITFHIELVKTKQQAKDARVKGLSSYFSAGQMVVNSDQEDFLEEFRTFGATDDYHILDALAYGPEFWRNGNFSRDSEEEESEVTDDRDVETGYSQI